MWLSWFPIIFVVLNYYFLPTWLIALLERWYPQVVFRHATHEKIVALTIDDGPKSETTHKILDLLKKYNTKATWFIIGQHVIQNDPSYHLLKRMVKEGHQLGNHTWYDRLSLQLSNRDLGRELSGVKRIIKAVAGDHTKIFRPGGGFFNQRMIDCVTQRNYKLILGSNYPHDGERILRWLTPIAWYHWFILKRISPGDIIILHDVDTALPTLEVVIPELLKRGYKIVTVSQLLSS